MLRGIYLCDKTIQQSRDFHKNQDSGLTLGMGEKGNDWVVPEREVSFLDVGRDDTVVYFVIIKLHFFCGGSNF